MYMKIYRDEYVQLQNTNFPKVNENPISGPSFPRARPREESLDLILDPQAA